MTWRRACPDDIPAIREHWKRAGYGFDFPEFDRLLSSWVAIEDGRIVAWVGAQPQVEIIAIMDCEWGSPHQRSKLFATLHQPVAQDVRDAGHEKAFAQVDPRYAHFGRRLKSFGWFRAWDTYWVLAERILGKKR